MNKDIILSIKKSMIKNASLTLAGVLHGVQNKILDESFKNKGIHRIVGQNFGRGLAHGEMVDTGIIHAGTSAFMDKHPRVHEVVTKILDKVDPKRKILNKAKTWDSFISGATVPELNEMAVGAHDLGKRLRRLAGTDYKLSKRDAVIGRALARGDLGKAFRLHHRSHLGRVTSGEVERVLGAPEGTLRTMNLLTSGDKHNDFRTRAIGRLVRRKVNSFLNTTHNPIANSLIPGSLSHVSEGVRPALRDRGIVSEGMSNHEEKVTKQVGNMYAGAVSAGVADPYLGALNAFKSSLIDPRVIESPHPKVRGAATTFLDKTVNEPVAKMYQDGESGKKFSKVENKFKTLVVNPLTSRVEELAYRVGKGVRELGIPEYREATEKGVSTVDFLKEKWRRRKFRKMHPDPTAKDDIR